jgi:hypothetical protein
MSTRPPSHRTWQIIPATTVEAGGLEDLPRSGYGVQPIWRMVAAEPPAVIEFGPPRLPNDSAGPRLVEVPPEERIHSLAWLQRAGLITSEELELAVERLLAANALPVPEPQPTPKATISTAHSRPPKTRRVLIAYGATAVIFVLAVVMTGPLMSRFLFAQPSAVQILPSTSPTPEQPSPSPTAAAPQLDLRSILIKPGDLIPGYVVVRSDPNPLCGTCVPALYSLSVGLQNVQLQRALTSAASVAANADDGSSMVRALTAWLSTGSWASGKGLGDESFLHTATKGGRSYFYVVWRAGAITNEIILIALPGSRTLQSAIDLAKIQQARLAAAHA